MIHVALLEVTCKTLYSSDDTHTTNSEKKNEQLPASCFFQKTKWLKSFSNVVVARVDELRLARSADLTLKVVRRNEVQHCRTQKLPLEF